MMKSSLVKVNRSYRIFAPGGDIEETSGQLFSDLRKALTESAEEIILDCSKLTQVVSSHINYLWQVRLECEEANVPLRLDAVSDKLKRVLQLLDLYGQFTVVAESTEETTGEDNTEYSDPKRECFNATFEATTDKIGQTLLKFRKYSGGLEMPKIFLFELETVFYEIVTNIRLHGQVKRGDNIEFTAEPHKNKVILTFKYKGILFDPTKYDSDFDPETTAKMRQKRGYGLTMIKRMTDNITYQRTDESTNILILEKNWRDSNV